MPFAIEMYFDESGDAAVRALAAGMGFVGDPASRPHVSLAVAEQVDPLVVGDAMDRFALGMEKFRLEFAALGFFPGEAPVAFLAPKVTPELLELHRRFLEWFLPLVGEVWPHYLAKSWMPHCIIGTGIPAAAASVLQQGRLPIRVRVVGIALVEFSPVQLRHESPLPDFLIAGG